MSSTIKKLLIWLLLTISGILLASLYANSISSNSDNSDTVGVQIETSSSEIESSKKLIILDIIPGSGFEKLISSKDEKALKAAEKNYSLIVTTTDANNLRYSKLSIYDTKNSQIQINKDEIGTDNQREIWFNANPSTQYKLNYEFRNDDGNLTHHTESFWTPSTSPNLKQVIENGEKSIESYLKYDIKRDLKNKAERNDIWLNMKPYYIPTKEEKEATFKAYWETFIKDWKDFKLQLISADASGFIFQLNYNWPEPDMLELNKKIEERENYLKKQVGSDYKKMFQIITKELPDMIRSTSIIHTSKRQVQTDSLSREEYKNQEIDYIFADELNNFKIPFDKLYP